MSFFETEHGRVRGARVATVVGTVTITIIVALAVTIPKYRVWQQELEGKAELSRATYNRQIAVEEAQAKKDAAALLGEAEVARAHGLAEANKIVGESLGSPENYIRYLWIQEIGEVSGQVIYVPTEVGLPLTEAVRLSEKE